jgi:hypothetical protein
MYQIHLYQLFLYLNHATSVQDVPFQDSVNALIGGLPPNAKAAVFNFPDPAKLDLAVFKSLLLSN